jgi:hypothetical protein
MSVRDLPGDKGRPARKAYNLTAICEPIVYKMWEPRRLTTGITLPFYPDICLESLSKNKKEVRMADLRDNI